MWEGWGDGGMGRWGDGEIEKDLVMALRWNIGSPNSNGIQEKGIPGTGARCSHCCAS
ncbi:hypothetical protein [Okeania sp. SIO2B3]|uniref:hypothetical protein n=1 Tax=Okeania sp. SIO2B3 TaxID=2607784 RepID=UPI0013C1478C|nr:hypothetical protein [Okeania sp. SIO2B3]NET44538.1 hypothetical protein [Okeania sp. SIO2B3]